MIGQVIEAGDNVGIILGECKLTEIDNDVRKIFSNYLNKLSEKGKIHGWPTVTYTWTLIQRPKEFSNFSQKAKDLFLFLLKPGRTAKKKRHTIIIQVLVGDRKYYCTKKELINVLKSGLAKI